MSKIEKSREKYAADADVMASKSRFGYFSVLPSHTAAHTDFAQTVPQKDENGRVKTQPRNIYSGNTSAPALQKNYFSYTPSAFHGSAYEDPGKNERRQQMEQNKREEGKDGFKPAKLNKSLMSSSYAYMSPFDPKKDQKNYRDGDGKVIVQQPNVLVSPASKISYNRSKEFKYVECPAEKKKTETAENDKQPFRTGNTHTPVFASNKQTYFDADLKKKDQKPSVVRSASHEGPFKPSCIAKTQFFTSVKYVEEGKGKEQVQKVQKKQNTTEPFKLLKVEHNSRPTPSIALSKVNMLKVCR